MVTATWADVIRRPRLGEGPLDRPHRAPGYSGSTTSRPQDRRSGWRQCPRSSHPKASPPWTSSKRRGALARSGVETERRSGLGCPGRRNGTTPRLTCKMEAGEDAVTTRCGPEASTGCGSSTPRSCPSHQRATSNAPVMMIQRRRPTSSLRHTRLPPEDLEFFQARRPGRGRLGCSTAWPAAGTSCGRPNGTLRARPRCHRAPT